MVSSHARAASPQALLFLTSLPNHKAWWPQEARVAAEMNSAALGRPWPLFQPTCRPVGTLSSPVDSQVPRHIGIIMDGNGRWARRRGRPASFGHRAGVRAIKRALQACEDLGVHTLSIYAFSTAISARMYQPSLADPDLIIRTAGEHRVSNFLLWQGAYAEMLVTDTLWPDFGEDDLKAALADYASRVRRFGARPADEVVAS